MGLVIWTAAAAAARSLQSCLTLCDPIDGSPPGCPVPGILQARTLGWVAISFSNAWKWKAKVKLLSHVWFLATPWTLAHQAPPSMGFSRQEYCSGVPLPSPHLHLSLTESYSFWWTFKVLFVFVYLATACGVFVPWPGIEPGPPAVKVWRFNHWSAREFHIFIYFFICACVYWGTIDLFKKGCFVLRNQREIKSTPNISLLFSDLFFKLEVNNIFIVIQWKNIEQSENISV